MQAMHVNEPRADDQSTGVDGFVGGAATLNCGNPAIFDEHVIDAVDRLGWIDYPSATNQKPRHADDPFK
jgi:hypothetical protein